MHPAQSTAIVRIRLDEARQMTRAETRARRHAIHRSTPLAAAATLLIAGLLLGSLPSLSQVDAGGALALPRPVAAPAPTGH